MSNNLIKKYERRVEALSAELADAKEKLKGIKAGDGVSRHRPEGGTMTALIVKALLKKPGMTSDQIASKIGEASFRVRARIGYMVREGLIEAVDRGMYQATAFGSEKLDGNRLARISRSEPKKKAKAAAPAKKAATKKGRKVKAPAKTKRKAKSEQAEAEPQQAAAELSYIRYRRLTYLRHLVDKESCHRHTSLHQGRTTMATDLSKLGAASRGDLFRYRPEDLTLVEDKEHPLYDPRVEWKPAESMIDSIIRSGVAEPILVRRNGVVNGKPVVEVINGRQRTKAAIEANVRLRAEGKEPVLVPARIIQCDDAEAQALMYLTNELRTNDDEVMRAEKIKRYIDMAGDERNAAVVFGVTQKTIKTYLVLANSEPAVKKAVKDGLPLKDVKRLDDMPREKQRKVIEQLREKGMIGSGDGSLLIEREAKVHEPAEKKPKKQYARSSKLIKHVANLLSGAGDLVPVSVLADALLWAAGDKSDFAKSMKSLGIDVPGDDWKPGKKDEGLQVAGACDESENGLLIVYCEIGRFCDTFDRTLLPGDMPPVERKVMRGTLTCVSLHDPSRRRGLWFRVDGSRQLRDRVISLFAGREGDDSCATLREGHILHRVDVDMLLDLLGTARYSYSLAHNSDGDESSLMSRFSPCHGGWCQDETPRCAMISWCDPARGSSCRKGHT